MERFRLGDLVRWANRVLPESAGPGDSRRVRWAPNERLVRYYTTLGLLDRPLELRARTAYYGRRHLTQLLAIKALQGRGATLREVQVALSGLPDRALEEAAGLPAGWADALSSAIPEDRTGPPPLEDPFWERAPAPLDVPSPAPEAGAAADAGAGDEDIVLAGITLGRGVTLLFPRELLEEIPVEKLRRSARPLIKLLETSHQRGSRNAGPGKGD